MLKQEFGVGYTMLGAAMSVFFAFSDVYQTLAGFAWPPHSFYKL